MLAGQPEDAEASLSAALTLTPQDADLLADRARARAMKKDWRGAERDLAGAKAAGMKCAFARYGYVSLVKALKHTKHVKADYTLDSISDLLKILA